MTAAARLACMRPMPSPVSMPRVYGFAPVVDARAAILIVGSMPGVASLQAQQYYAHPRNQFWKIMDHICGAGVQLPYAARLRALQEHGLALWDVLQSCVRPGSLDAAIVHTSAAPNDLPALLRRQPRIARLCCNGGAAYRALQRHFAVPLAQNFAHLDIRQLPSTSPANAGCSPQRKLTAWTAALARPPAAGQPHRPASALL